MRFQEIMQELSGKYRVTILSETSSAALLDLVFLDGKSRLFSETFLFFGYDDQLPKTLPENLVMISDKDPTDLKSPSAGQERRNLAVIPKDRAGAFFNDARALIEKSRRTGYYDAVIEALDQTRSIPAFIDSASLSLGASLVLCDIEYRILAWSLAIPVTDPIWKANIGRGYCDYEFIREVRRLKAVQSMSGSRETFEVNCSQSPYRKYAGLLFVRGEPMGFLLLIESEDSYRETHPRMLNSLCSALSYGIPRYAPAWVCQRTGFQRLLYNLLIGADLSDFPEAIQELPAFSASRVFCCRKDENTGAEKKDAEIVPAGFLEGILPEAVLVRHRKAFYVLVPDGRALQMAKEGSAFHAVLKERGLTAGMSPLLRDLGSFQRACRMAEKVQAETDPDHRILTFESLLPQILVDDLKEHMDLCLYIHPALRILESYDEKNGSGLLMTLGVYLKNGESIKETADALYLHRNSVVYRLNKIEEIGRISLQDPEVRFGLRLGLLILEKREKVEGRDLYDDGGK